jgi:hypothetical protein
MEPQVLSRNTSLIHLSQNKRAHKHLEDSGEGAGSVCADLGGSLQYAAYSTCQVHAGLQSGVSLTSELTCAHSHTLSHLHMYMWSHYTLTTCLTFRHTLSHMPTLTHLYKRTHACLLAHTHTFTHALVHSHAHTLWSCTYIFWKVAQCYQTDEQ